MTSDHQAAASGRQSARRVPGVAQRLRPQAGSAAVPGAGRCAAAAGLRQAALQAAAAPAGPSFAAARVPFPFRVPAAALRQAEAAAQVVWPNVEPLAVAAQPDAEVAAVEARPGVAVGAEVVQSDAAVVAEPGAVAAPGAQGAPAADPLVAVACLSLPPFAAPPRSVSTARAMGLSTVAWPTMQS